MIHKHIKRDGFEKQEQKKQIVPLKEKNQVPHE
jgi:hypothetical protein